MNLHASDFKTTRAVSVSVPGSTFLMGEHAILHGASGIVCALNKRMIVKGKKRTDDCIVITSALGTLRCQLTTLTSICINTKPEHRFVAETLLQLQPVLSSGFELHIHSAFSHTMGLGSSSSVTLAVLAALSFLFGQNLNHETLFHQALAIIKKVQGVGSGADLAASLFGGIIDYTPSSFQIIPLDKTLPIQLYYSGYKTPTVQVIQHVAAAQEKKPALFKALYHQMALCTEAASNALKNKSLTTFGSLMNSYQQLMYQLGVSDTRLNQLINTANHHAATLGAKISGSGLGDCIVVLTTRPDQAIYTLEQAWIPVSVSSEGLIIEPRSI